LKSEIINLRKKIYENLKLKALNFESNLSPELIQYRKDQQQFSNNSFTSSNIDELKLKVKKSDVIYLGDFHTFDQNIRNVVRILKVLLNSDNDCIVALEMVDAKYQFYIDTYLEGHLTDLEFLESIDYHDSWRFPWSHYKLIFELAKEHNIEIIGLNTNGNLIERDIFGADIISKSMEQNPDTQHLVVYGELHITNNKIPLRVSKILHNDNYVIVHQNLDEVYWKQVEADQNDKIIKFNNNEYCLNSAPPWIKYESMIYWYENVCDDPDFDIHEYIIENGKKIFGDDTHENFSLICKEMIKAININFNLDELDDFNLHDHTSLEFVEEKIQSYGVLKLSKFYCYLIETGQSFKLPDQNIFYCSSYSMNRISYLAGVHIFHIFLKQSEPKTINMLSDTDKVNKFILFTFESLFAFFFSKVMNPHRKCELYLDIRKKASLEENSKLKDIYKSTADILDGQNLTDSLVNFTNYQTHQTAMYIGHILGEYLYESIFYQKKSIDIESDLLRAKINEFSFQKIRLLLLKETNYKEHQKRYF
jgi:hypothetical protein